MAEINQKNGLSIEYSFNQPNEVSFKSMVPILKIQKENSFQYYALISGKQAMSNKFINYYKEILNNKKEIRKEILSENNHTITQNKLPDLDLNGLVNDEKLIKNIEIIIDKILKQTILLIEKELVRITNNALEENGLENKVSGFEYDVKDNKLYFIFKEKDFNIKIEHEYSMGLEGDFVIKKTFFNSNSRYDFNYKGGRGESNPLLRLHRPPR